MAGSYYPIGNKSDLSQRLLAILKEIKQRNEEIAYSAMCGDDGQFDNSYYDGGSVAEVRLAMGLLAEQFSIKQELDGFEPKILR